MNVKDEVYIYLEGPKKYLYLNQSSVASHNSPSHLSFVYKKSHMVHSSDKTVDIISQLESERLGLLRLWLTIDTIIPANDKAELLTLVDFCKNATFSAPSLSINKYLFDKSLVKEGLRSGMQHILDTFEEYNKCADKINSMIKSYNLGEVAFYCYEQARTYTTKGQVPMLRLDEIDFNDKSPLNISFAHLVIPSVQLKESQKSLIKNLIKNADKTPIVSSLEDKRATTEMFLVHTTSQAGEGFVGEGSYAGPLNTAKLFYDERKAKKAAQHSNIESFQIWKVGFSFKKPTSQSENFAGSGVISSIVAYQEKQQLEELMKNEEYKRLLAQAENYKRQLIEHNIVPSNHVNGESLGDSLNISEPIIKKKNKI